jgi:hypothetical protein
MAIVANTVPVFSLYFRVTYPNTDLVNVEGLMCTGCREVRSYLQRPPHVAKKYTSGLKKKDAAPQIYEVDKAGSSLRLISDCPHHKTFS